MISGVPEHVDGRMIGITEAAGARLINRDRMWHYVEGIRNWSPIWPRHGIRILPGPSSMWFDATGTRLPSPLFPGSDTLGQLQYIMSTGYDYSWFVLTQSIIKKEFALSGSEQNPDLTGKSWLMTARRATNKGAPAPVEAFKSHGVDFIVRDNLADLVGAMNALVGDNLLKLEHLKAQIEARDREIANPYVKDTQVMNIHNARRYIGDRLIRTASAAPDSRSRPRPADRGETQHPDPQDAGRVRDRSGLPRLRQRRQDHAGTLRRRRSGRVRRRRHARLSFAGRDFSRRLPVLRPQRRTRGGEGGLMRPGRPFEMFSEAREPDCLRRIQTIGSNVPSDRAKSSCATQKHRTLLRSDRRARARDEPAIWSNHTGE